MGGGRQASEGINGEAAQCFVWSLFPDSGEPRKALKQENEEIRFAFWKDHSLCMWETLEGKAGGRAPLSRLVWQSWRELRASKASGKQW